MSEATEKAVRMGAKLYEARATVKFLLGKRYAEVIEIYQRGLKVLMESRRIDAIQAAIELCKMTDEPEEGLFILAAAVELVEPSSTPKEAAHGV